MKPSNTSLSIIPRAIPYQIQVFYIIEHEENPEERNEAQGRAQGHFFITRRQLCFDQLPYIYIYIIHYKYHPSVSYL